MVQLIKNKRHIHFKDVDRDATDIILPKQLLHIGRDSFRAAKVQHIELPKGLKVIGPGAFCGCHDLTAITIPNSVESIQTCAFGNTGLRYITILADNLRFIGPISFYHFGIINKNNYSYRIIEQDRYIYELNIGYGKKFIQIAFDDLNELLFVCLDNTNRLFYNEMFTSKVYDIRIYESFIIKHLDKFLSFDFTNNNVEIKAQILEIAKLHNITDKFEQITQDFNLDE